jgi:putative transposase
VKQQLPVLNRFRLRAPNLSALDRFLFGFWSLFLDPHRVQPAAVSIRPSTLLKFHSLLKQRKYRLLYSTGRKGKPGPKGPSRELIQAIVTMKQRNPRYGIALCPMLNLAKPPAAVLTSTNSSGNVIAAGHTSYPW